MLSKLNDAIFIMCILNSELLSRVHEIKCLNYNII